MDYLESYRQRFADEVGPAINKSLAKIVNTIWTKGRDPEVSKDIKSIHPRPVNIKCDKVDINSEVLSGLQKPARGRDSKLRAVQATIARATVPAVKIAGLCMQKDFDKKEILDMALDTVTMLSSANEGINQFRPDSLRPGVQPRFQSLCKIPKGDDTSQLLFGSELTERIKAATQWGKVAKKYGYGAPHQGYYPMHNFAGRGSRRGFHPYMPSRGYSRGPSFLGKTVFQEIKRKIMKKC